MSTMPNLGDPCHQSVEPRDRLHRHLRVGDAVQREATSAWLPMSRTISPHAGKDEVARTGDTSIPGIAQRAPPTDQAAAECLPQGAGQRRPREYRQCPVDRTASLIGHSILRNEHPHPTYIAPGPPGRCMAISQKPPDECIDLPTSVRTTGSCCSPSATIANRACAV